MILLTIFSRASFETPVFSNLFKLEVIIAICFSGILAALNRVLILISSSPFVDDFLFAFLYYFILFTIIYFYHISTMIFMNRLSPGAKNLSNAD